MKLKDWIGLTLALCLIGCSSDDPQTEAGDTPQVRSFVAVGEDLENVYQFSFDAATETGSSISLTSELGVVPNYLTLRQIEDFLSFYTFSNGSFSLATKSLGSGIVGNNPDFYTATSDKSITWGINSEDKVYFGYFDPFGSRNLGLLEVDLDGANEKDTTIDFNVESAYQPFLYDGILYVSYKDNLGSYKLATYDTSEGALGPILNFGTFPFSFLVSEDGDLAVFKYETEPLLEFYDAKSLTFLENKPLERNFGFPLGPVPDAFLVGDKMYFNIIYPQPSRFANGPAIYDTNTQEVTLPDLFGRGNEVEQELGQSIQLTTQVYSVSKEVFLIGYATLGTEVLGGVMQLSPEGELLGNVTMPFFPNYFVRD